MNEVLLYTRPGCIWCVRARHLLRSRGIPFVELDIRSDAALRAAFDSVAKTPTVPQIVIGGRSIGGFRELSDLDRRGQLEGLVRCASAKDGPVEE